MEKSENSRACAVRQLCGSAGPTEGMAREAVPGRRLRPLTAVGLTLICSGSELKVGLAGESARPSGPLVDRVDLETGELMNRPRRLREQQYGYVSEPFTCAASAKESRLTAACERQARCSLTRRPRREISGAMAASSPGAFLLISSFSKHHLRLHGAAFLGALTALPSGAGGPPPPACEDPCRPLVIGACK